MLFRLSDCTPLEEDRGRPDIVAVPTTRRGRRFPLPVMLIEPAAGQAQRSTKPRHGHGARLNVYDATATR
jgi:hypothetical protein